MAKPRERKWTIDETPTKWITSAPGKMRHHLCSPDGNTIIDFGPRPTLCRRVAKLLNGEEQAREHP